MRCCPFPIAATVVDGDATQGRDRQGPPLLALERDNLERAGGGHRHGDLAYSSTPVLSPGPARTRSRARRDGTDQDAVGALKSGYTSTAITKRMAGSRQ